MCIFVLCNLVADTLADLLAVRKWEAFIHVDIFKYTAPTALIWRYFKLTRYFQIVVSNLLSKMLAKERFLLILCIVCPLVFKMQVCI